MFNREVTNDERRTMNKALQDMAALQEQNQELHDIVISLKYDFGCFSAVARNLKLLIEISYR